MYKQFWQIIIPLESNIIGEVMIIFGSFFLFHCWHNYITVALHIQLSLNSDQFSNFKYISLLSLSPMYSVEQITDPSDMYFSIVW